MSKPLNMVNLRETGLDEAQDTQLFFRKILRAMSEPGQWLETGAPALNACPTSLFPTCFMALKSLCDHMVRLWLSPSIGQDAEEYLRFNTRAAPSSLDRADYALFGDMDWNLIANLRLGDEEFPEKSTLMLIQHPESGASDISITARGPGIKDKSIFPVSPQILHFFNARIGLDAYPVGFDIILLRRDGSLCGIPRSLELSWPM